MKAIITGSQGFVGNHLTKELMDNGYSVSGMDLADDDYTSFVDLLDKDSVYSFIKANQPDVLFHLAAQASVPLSWDNPQRTYELNLIGTINLLEAVHREKETCRIVIIGSSDQYGMTAHSDAISENEEQHPQNPYAASKRAQEEIALIYVNRYLLDICMTRSFNHCGPGQKLGFLIPDICSGIVQVEKGNANFLKVGNTESIRDFTDVRDVVRAYRLIFEKGINGEVYNVGSGVGRKVQDVLDALIGMASCEISIQPDKERMRPSDTPVIVCDNTKLREHTDWMPQLPFEQTLRDSLGYYRSIV